MLRRGKPLAGEMAFFPQHSFRYFLLTCCATVPENGRIIVALQNKALFLTYISS
jgi:hypothetical protein